MRSRGPSFWTLVSIHTPRIIKIAKHKLSRMEASVTFSLDFSPESCFVAQKNQSILVRYASRPKLIMVPCDSVVLQLQKFFNVLFRFRFLQISKVASFSIT